MSAQNSGTIGVLTIDVISKPIRTNVDAIRLQGYFGKMSIGGDTRMSETSEDAHEESPHDKVDSNAPSHGIPSAHRGRCRTCLRVYASLCRRAVPNPLRLYGRQPCSWEIASSSASLSTGSASRERTLNFSTSMNPREGMCLCSFHFTRNPGTSSNASLRLAATPSKRRVARSSSTASRSKMTHTQNVCPAASAPATIFPPFAPPTSCPMTTLLRITSSRLSSSGQSSRTGYRSGSRKDTSSLWAIIAPEQRQPHLGHRPREPNQRGCLHGFLVIRSAQPEKALADLEGGGRHPI